MQQADYYQILGISETATAEEIKKAYRTIAKENHPDRNPGNTTAEEKFKSASEAYETLSDPAKRKKYDQLRRLGATGGGGFGFGNRTSRRSSTRGPVYTAPDDVTLDDDYADFMRTYGTPAQQQRYERSRSESTSSGGFGGIEDLLGDLFGSRGKEKESGSAAPGEPQPTDDPFFKRLGNDAYVELSINLAQALLSSKVRVRTPSGKKVTLTIPEGSSDGKKLRIPAMGFPAASGAGDLYIVLSLRMPENLTEEQKEAVDTMAEKLGLRH